MPLTTKYYQAPELLLHPHHYTKKADMWSVGCIFIEMLTGTKAFCGEHALEQMSLILDTIPVTKDDWQSVACAGCGNAECCDPPILFDEQDNDGCPLKPLEIIVRTAPPYAINLLKQMLAFDPVHRVDAEDGLAHPYLLSYSNPQDEPSCSRPFHIEDEIDECSMSDLEAMMNENYSTNSSFSRSTDATMSHPGQLQGIEDSNLMRVNSSAGLTTNGSYRHLLSLAENIHSEALSESEARTIACDLDYGVQIRECSFNKDRMSMDFRPISTNAGCFDPYKWDLNANSDAAAKCTKKDPLSNILKLHKSLEATQTGVSRLDTGYHSSYCSSSVTNRMSNVASLSHWSLSSLDISSDHEQRHGSATPDSVSSPSAHANTDIGSCANSPTFQDDPQAETAVSRRHNDSLHQSGRRIHHSHHHHHHHSHHHHHHHHHHGKHKNRQSHPVMSSGVQQKAGSGDSSGEQTDTFCNREKHSKPKHDHGKRTRSVKGQDSQEPVDVHEAPDTFVVLPKHIVVTGPDNVVISKAVNKDEDCKKLKRLEHVQRSNSLYDTGNDLPGDQESQCENGTVMTKHPNSAFSKYEPQCIDDVTTLDEENSIKGHSYRYSPADSIKRSVYPTDLLSQSTIETMWKADLGVKPNASDTENRRPRTWSEGCSSRPVAHNELVPILVRSKNLECSSIFTCRLVQKIRSQFNQIFSDGCCLTNTDEPTHLGHSVTDSLIRMRHFSDDRSFICSPRAFTGLRESCEPCEGNAIASGGTTYVLN